MNTIVTNQYYYDIFLNEYYCKSRARVVLGLVCISNLGITVA
jgi:hypothetical protein